MDRTVCAGFEFFSNFDSANFSKVDVVPHNESVVTVVTNATKTVVPEIPDVEFNIWTRPDCYGTEFQNSNRTWFYFGIRGRAPGLLVKLNLVDINKQAKMYSQGMAPVFRVLPGKPNWERVRDRPTYIMGDVFVLTFKYRTPENLESVTYFAFTYPYSYTDLQNNLNSIDLRHQYIEPLCKDDIYYTRECVAQSLEGRKVDLITISSYHNISSERETRLKNLFPDLNVPRPFRFVGKKYIFISARVHPGETPSSFVFNGFLNLLLNRDDQVAIVLRRTYVFKLIPCLNPDGVAKGHYRTDTRGVNLNRVYLKPSLTLHPSVFAARALLRYYHYGFEKEDEFDSSDSGTYESCISEENVCVNHNKLTKKVSTMTLEENEKNKNDDPETWCAKCKRNIIKLEETMPGISSIIPTFNRNTICLGKECCQNCGEEISDDSNADVFCDTESYPQGDTNCNESGLYLYIDMHGHASKKGIFMYGNHFEELEQNVECMLLPKIMSINNHNFHFTACNFTEKNMYLRKENIVDIFLKAMVPGATSVWDRRDGMSREGSGRVAVLKMTGLVRSYTLECNYNTGRLVNVLPPTIKESAKGVHILPVPPKYTPHIFEEVGKALGSSILDLTGQNPITRLPGSEFHSLSGLREWLRIHYANDFGGDMRNLAGKLKIRHSASLHAQGKSLRAVVLKSRSTSAKTTPKKCPKSTRSTSVPIERKENVIADDITPQPSCSHASSIGSSSIDITIQRIRPGLRPNKSLNMRNRPKNPTSRPKSTAAGSDKQTKSLGGRSSHMSLGTKQKLKVDMASKLHTVKEKQSKTKQSEQDRIQLREICFIKDAEGKKVIAKYKSENNEGDDKLIVSWDAGCTSAQVFSQKSRLPSFLTEKMNEAGPSKRSAFRVHNFTRSTAFSKTKRNKRNLRRLAGQHDSCVKIEKIKKRKKLKKVT